MPKSGVYYSKEAKKHGLTVRHGKGDHDIIEAPAGRGYMTVPLHRELGRGLECKILKWFKTLGILLTLSILVCSCAICYGMW